MSLPPGGGSVAVAVAAALSGVVLGWAYFRALRAAVERHVGGARAGTLALLTAGRLAGVAIVLVVLARLGAAALLAGFGGFLLARVLALRATRGER